MKHSIILCVVFLTGYLRPHTALGQTGSLEVTVSHIKSHKGKIQIGIFEEKDFLKTPVEGKIVKASKGTVTVVFENVKKGSYAISIIHDENENGILDANKLGIPKEGFAFSNNASGTLGPPSFEKARIEIGDEPIKQALVLKYM
ncbi:MAG TPA: DUF2141 domain-containing protein [Chryseolinea sp.]|nr:DUF2141 domain-containing protein [Chryseolinea sp.]